MSHTVVLGSGLTGTIMAYKMREKLRREDSLTVVNLGTSYYLVPCNPWVAVGRRDRNDIAAEVAAIVARRAIELRPEGAKKVHPKENRVELNDGSFIDYGYLIIATGPDSAFDEVPGLGPSGHTQSICHIEQSQIPPRNINWSSQGKWIHAAKIGFERYFLHKVRQGRAETFHEGLALDMRGIKKLKAIHMEPAE